jgi:PAS domain S-box-containing protein
MRFFIPNKIVTLYQSSKTKMKIIVVEDNPAINKLISYYLEKSGHEVIGVYSAAELFSAHNIFIPDLLLLDYTLPDMTGKELVDLLHEKNYSTPFIIVTGHSDIQIAIDVMKVGAMDFVLKDENLKEILPTIITRVEERIRIEKKYRQVQEQLIKNEALYRNTVDQIPDPILYYNKNEIFFINQGFEKKIGYKLQDISLENIHKIMPRKHFQKVNEWAKTCQINDVFPVFEVDIPNSAGKTLRFIVKAVRSVYKNKPAIMVVFSDITEKYEFEAKLMKSVIETEERERIRFSRDLHDELGPILSGVKLYVDLLKNESKSENEKSEIRNKINELLDSAIQISRNMSRNMIPEVLIDFGVNKAIQSFINQLSASEGPVISFESYLKVRLEQNVEISIYRILKELINNSLKHANAKKIDIQIFNPRKGKLRLFYEDDGIGFDQNILNNKQQNNGIGLTNIINRMNILNAGYQIETANNEGFAISISIPC